MPTFFCPVQALYNLVLVASPLSEVNTKKYIDPIDDFGLYTFVQDLPWRKDWGSCFECELFGKLVP